MSDELHLVTVAPDGLNEGPSPARMWHYLLGGKDYQQIDREAAEAILAGFPAAGYVARQCRLGLTRMTRFLADAGIRQILDLGCGLPAPADFENVHEIVQGVHPDARVVYVDSDKVVLAHARALLTPHTPTGVCAYVDSDARDIDAILEEAEQTLDFSEPVGVLMYGILGAIGYDDARHVVRRLLDTIPAGSYLAVEDGVDTGAAVNREANQRRHETGVDRYQMRTKEEILSYFEGLELVEPGLVPITEWRPDPFAIGEVQPVHSHGCVVRVP